MLACLFLSQSMKKKKIKTLKALLISILLVYTLSSRETIICLQWQVMLAYILSKDQGWSVGYF